MHSIRELPLITKGSRQRKIAISAIVLVGLLQTSCGSAGPTPSLQIRTEAAAAAKAAAETKPIYPDLPAKCTQKMARVHPQLGGIASHDFKQWEANADAQDARTAFCAQFYRSVTSGGPKEAS